VASRTISTTSFSFIGNLELLGSHAKEFQDTALRACLRGADLTYRLLAFSRKQALEPKPSDINARVASSSEFGCVSNLEEILWRRSPSMGIWA
jgi:hypothetical protein